MRCRRLDSGVLGPRLGFPMRLCDEDIWACVSGVAQVVSEMEWMS